MNAERLSFPGPFEQHEVIVTGYKVPFLHAQTHDGGMLTVVLDDRFGLELSVAEAERIVPFLADCIAVALGYPSHPSVDDAARPRRENHPIYKPVHNVVAIVDDSDQSARKR